MRILPACLALLAVSQALAAEQQQSGCGLHLLAELQVGEAGSDLITASLNGIEGQFHFQPMSISSNLWQSTVRRLGVKPEKVAGVLDGPHGKPLLSVHVREIVIGEARFDESIVVGSDPQSSSDHTLGTLGSDIFGRVDYELDLKHGKVRLFSP